MPSSSATLPASSKSTSAPPVGQLGWYLDPELVEAFEQHLAEVLAAEDRTEPRSFQQVLHRVLVVRLQHRLRWCPRRQRWIHYSIVSAAPAAFSVEVDESLVLGNRGGLVLGDRGGDPVGHVADHLVGDIHLCGLPANAHESSYVVQII